MTSWSYALYALEEECKCQRQLFNRSSSALLMSYFMAIGMEIYNTAINSGVTQLAGGFSALSYEVILDALKEASYMGIIVFIISELFGNKIGAGFMVRHTAQDDPPYFRQLMRQAGTVAFMCPAMSLTASILFNVILAQRSFIDLPVIWIGTVLKNFPMAFFWNVFAAAPLARAVYDALFQRRSRKVEGASR